MSQGSKQEERHTATQELSSRYVMLVLNEAFKRKLKKSNPKPIKNEPQSSWLQPPNEELQLAFSTKTSTNLEIVEELPVSIAKRSYIQALSSTPEVNQNAVGSKVQQVQQSTDEAILSSDAIPIDVTREKPRTWQRKPFVAHPLSQGYDYRLIHHLSYLKKVNRNVSTEFLLS